MASDNPIQLYADLISSPARIVYWFCVLNKIPHELKIIKLADRENLKEGYEKLHPFRKVPCIDDNGFVVFESQTILRYLAQKFDVPDHWYPKDLKQRIRTDEYFDWHHLNIRAPVADLFFQCFTQKFRKNPSDPVVIEKRMKDYSDGLKGLENFWLQGRKFIGGEEPSIADLSAFAELYQMKTIHFDYTGFPTIQRYMADMQQLEEFQAAHQMVNRLIDLYPKL